VEGSESRGESCVKGQDDREIVECRSTRKSGGVVDAGEMEETVAPAGLLLG